MEEEIDKNKIINNSELDEELEELKAQFIVNGRKFKNERLKDYLKTIINHCKMSPEGEIYVENKILTRKISVGFIILARFIGNKLDSRINDTITPSEISTSLNISKDNVRARASELSDEKYIIKPEEGKYQFNQAKIEEFLGLLEKSSSE